MVTWIMERHQLPAGKALLKVITAAYPKKISPCKKTKPNQNKTPCCGPIQIKSHFLKPLMFSIVNNVNQAVITTAS